MSATAELPERLGVDTLPVVFFLSRYGFLLLGVVSSGVFAMGFILGALRLRGRLIQGSLVLAGPVGSLIAYRVINPDPGCTYDCPAKAGYAFFLFCVTAAWWLGLAAGTLLGWLADRRST